MNSTIRALALSTAFVGFGITAVPALAQTSETDVSTEPSALPANAIDCSRLPHMGYLDKEGNDDEDGISDEALNRSPAENDARLCSGLPIYVGDRRVHISMIWNRYTNTLMVYNGDRPIGHQDNGVIRLGYETYIGSPTPRNMTPLLADISRTVNGNATLGRAAANILPSATNGIGAATINALSNPCGRGGCGTSIVNLVDGAEAVAQADSNAANAINVATAIDFGSCGGPCPTPVVPHSGNAAGIVPAGNEQQ